MNAGSHFLPLLAAAPAWSTALGVWVLWFLLPITLIAILTGYVTSRPYRQQVRTEFLLDVMDTSLRQGERVEERIVALSGTRDLALGVPFHLLAAHLQRGLTFIPALLKVPRLAPPQIVTMLRAGKEIGDYGRVLPACRAVLADGPSQAMASVNYQVVLAFVFNPVVLLLIPFISAKVFPVFAEIASGFGRDLPAVARSIFEAVPFLFLMTLLGTLVIYALAVVLLGGPRAVSWIERGLPPISHWIYARVPWRRKRLQRDFATLLGLLLDAGLPEERAVLLAAESLSNRAFERRAGRVVERLRSGEKLDEALAPLDDSGELRWRLRNAAHGGGFARALAGWAQALDAQAFRHEQAAAQILTTSLVLLNGLTVALVGALVFAWMATIQSW